MSHRLLLILAAGASLSACASTLNLPPTEAIRYHLGAPIQRGSVSVEPLTSGGPPSLEFRTYATAVEAELARNGYAIAPAGTRSDLIATVQFTRTAQAGPARSSPVSIGIGGGGFSGGRRGGGVGLGGGVGFPLGGGRASEVIVTELGVTIKRRADQSPIWEGRAQAYADGSRPEAGPGAQAQRLAAAIFTDFPGESGRTIEVK
ncbi:MAG TPA: DUF4136 domain-containing protein [Sphingomonas sp.]|jgi:hypothetical protein